MKWTTTLWYGVALLLPYTMWGQGNDWRTMMQDQTNNFYDIQQAFEQEMGNRAYEKGLGIKQFRRWEYYWRSRVDARGNFPRPGHVLQEMQAYYQRHNNQKSYISGSGNWSIVGPIAIPNNGTGQLNGNGRLTSVAFHPTDANTIFVGAPSGGFWKTTDNGSTWTEFSSGLVRLGVSSIVVHPTTPNTIYIGTGDRDANTAPGYGVWRTTDGGLTWAPHNSGMGNRTVNEIIMHPTNSNIMIAATANNRIYRTTDGGATWVRSNLNFTAKDIAMHPTDPNTIYASGTRYARSTDGGVTWTNISSTLPGSTSRMALAVSPNQPDWVYILAGNNTGLQGVYRSTDRGVNFTLRTSTPNILGGDINGADNRSQAWYDLVMVADPTDANIIYTGGINIWKSIDGGANMSIVAYWVRPTAGIDAAHADHHALVFSPHNGTLYNGNDGGLYQTLNGGTTWTDLSSGLAIAQVYKIGVSQQTPDLVINGYQDNGTGISRGTEFITEIGGDGMECIIDPTDDNFMYGALYYGDIRRSINGGTTFTGISNAIGEQGDWVTPYKLDPNNPNRMFAGFDNVWRNDNVRGGTTWTQISNFSNTSNIRDVAIAPSNSNIVYISKTDNSFRRSNNATSASPTWTNLSGNLPINRTPLDIEIDPTDPDHVFIALNRNIYETTDGGLTWTDISGTLPNINLNTIVIDYDSPVEAMYVGMDVGVYYIDNTLSDWVMYATGLPQVEITELEIHYNGATCESTLYASTYGQGLWKGDLKDPGNIAPTACFEASGTEVCLGNPVQFTDRSSFTPTSWSWTITPNTFSFINSTTNNSQNPEVVFNAPGTYTVALSATNGTGNDIESKANFITVSSAAVASGFNDDFESYANCATSTTCGATTCPLGTNWINMTNGIDDNIDWRVDDGGTPSTGTGPSVDFNPGTSGGNYAYLEASSCSGQTALLISGCMQLNQPYTFEFAYHMEGTNMGTLHLDLEIAGTWMEDVIAPLATTDPNWRVASFDLAPYMGQTIRMRLRGITGPGFRSDMAIDDIRLVSQNVILNTQFTSVKATCVNNGENTVTWQIAQAEEEGLFIVQKYLNGTWESVGEVPATLQTSYKWTDATPLIGENLYRIAYQDLAKAQTYSLVAAANCTAQVRDVVIFPNPTKGTLNVQLYSSNDLSLPYRLTNSLGQQLQAGYFETQEGINTFPLPLQDLPQGVYLLHVQGKMLKVVKN